MQPSLVPSPFSENVKSAGSIRLEQNKHIGIPCQSNSPHLPMATLRVYVDKIKEMHLKYTNTQALSGSQDNYIMAAI